MGFTGFDEKDFTIFEIPGFAARMPALKAHITPKLRELGELLLPRLEAQTGQTFYPHVAQHLRRTTNPPVETWVAFSKAARSYKPFVHLRVAANAEGLKIACFLEDYAEEKPLFARRLRAEAAALAEHFAAHPSLRSYDLTDDEGKPLIGSALDEAVLTRLAVRLDRVKSQHASFGIPFASTNPLLASPIELPDAILVALETLMPLYHLGAEIASEQKENAHAHR